MILTFLKKYWQYITIAILGVALILSVRSCKNQTELRRISNNYQDSAFNYASKVKLNDSLITYRVKTLELTTKQATGENILLLLNKTDQDKEIKTLKSQVGKLSNIVTFYKGNASMDNSFSLLGTDSTVNIATHWDTVLTNGTPLQRITEKVFSWSNKWLTLHEVYNPITDSLLIKYHYKTDFQITSYRKGGNLFKRAQLFSDVTFSDSSLQVREFKALIIKEPPPKRFSLGPAVMYDPFSAQPLHLGISVQYALIRF